MNAAPPPPFPGERRRHPFLPWLLFPFFFLPICLRASADLPGDPNHTLVVGGHAIPVYATPDAQLAYARSTFTDIEEKAAALKAVARIHPEAREAAAMAEMELAYLALGDDYRLADRKQSLLAGERYLAVLDRYTDLPAVAAKALWYLGWIACDLMGDTARGIAWYRQLIDRFPSEKLNIVAPVPWLSIRVAEEGGTQHAAYPKAVLTWADIARLEIIRYTSDLDEARKSLRTLHRSGAGATGNLAAEALKVLVTRFGFDEESTQLVREYLERPDSDPLLKSDLSLALSASLRQTNVSGGR